jgi:hypothetical protein
MHQGDEMSTMAQEKSVSDSVLDGSYPKMTDVTLMFTFGEQMLSMVETPDGARRPLYEAVEFLTNEMQWPREFLSLWLAARGF